MADFCLFLKELLQDQDGKPRKDGENSDAYGNWNHETMREEATTPMQYEDRCVIAGTHFQYQDTPCGDETLRTAKVRSCERLTQQCVVAEERSMEIMVAMNELALELLPRVPSFPLHEIRDITAGTHEANHERIEQAVTQAENELLTTKKENGGRKRQKTRLNANKVRLMCCNRVA